MSGHGGVEIRGLGAPQSSLKEGRFGRMFRGANLQPLDPGIDAINALVKLMRDASQTASGDNAKIPAGYTYFGQFVDHDITFDPLSILAKTNDPDALVDFRTPRFDLDNLYGGGPADDPYLYDSQSPSNRGVKLLVGHNDESKGFERDDLQRNAQGRALIGDPRNDENLIVSQLQLLFIRFHAKVVDRVRKATKLEGAELFAESQRLVRWHYQWIVTHDFLNRIAGKPAADAAFAERKFFQWTNEPFVPVEFSGAAYRFGHSMVREIYDLNEIITDIPIFASADKPGPLEHLGGFRRLPAAWSVDWSFFFNTSSRKPQLSRRIDTKLSPPLHKLPTGVDEGRHSLAQLNLRRGRALQLPSGQAVADAMGAAKIAPDDLGLNSIDLPAAGKAKIKAATPLWYYLLREAELGGGESLGPVGGPIVAEVLVGLLQGDPLSYIRQQPTWKPELPGAKAGDFTLPDLVKFTLG